MSKKVEHEAKKRLNWRSFGAARVMFYSALTPVAIFMGWIYSVAFISVLSLIALVEGSIGAWRSDVPTPDDDSDGQ